MLKGVKARILIVEDEVGTGYALKLLLELEGFLVKIAADGGDAYALAQIDTPDIIITDINMPKVSGLELIKRIKRDHNLAGLPILIISAAEDAELEYALELGAKAVCRKPVDFDQLLSSLEGLVSVQAN